MDEIVIDCVPHCMTEIDSDNDEDKKDTVFDKIASGGVQVG